MRNQEDLGWENFSLNDMPSRLRERNIGNADHVLIMMKMGSSMMVTWAGSLIEGDNDSYQGVKECPPVKPPPEPERKSPPIGPPKRDPQPEPINDPPMPPSPGTDPNEEPAPIGDPPDKSGQPLRMVVKKAGFPIAWLADNARYGARASLLKKSSRNLCSY